MKILNVDIGFSQMNRNIIKIKEILLIIILLGVLSINTLYWCEQKEGFHVDEMFSYEQVGNTEYPKPEYDRPGEPVLNTWHDREYYVDYLTVSSEEAFDISAFYSSASQNSAHPPLYLTLFGMFISTFFQNVFSKWSGLLFNFIFYLLTLCAYYSLAKHCGLRKKEIVISTFLFGASIGVVSMTVFIRPYSMLLCSSIFYLSLHCRLIARDIQESKSVPWKLYISISCCFLFGALTHYYFLVFAFFVSLGYALILLFQKNTSIFLKYALLLTISFGIYCLLWPNIYTDMMSGYRGTEALGNLITQEYSYASMFIYYFRMLNIYLFGGYVELLIIALVLTFFICSLYTNWKNDKMLQKNISKDSLCGIPGKTISSQKKQALFLVVFSATFYFLLITRIAPLMPWGNVTYMELRYFVCIFPCLLLITSLAISLIIEKTKYLMFSKIVLYSVFAFCVLFGYISIGVDYLYKGADTQLLQLENYSQDRAIFVTDVNYYCSNMNVYFSKAAAVCQTNSNGIDDLSDVLMNLNDAEILLYIDSERDDIQSVVSRVYKLINATGCRYLFETAGLHRSDVYVLTLQ